MRVLGLVALLVSCPAIAAEPAVTAYKDCILGTALRLATGPDAADLIAKHAPAFCGAERRALDASLKSMSDPLARVKVLEGAEQQAIDTAIARILDLRAK